MNYIASFIKVGDKKQSWPSLPKETRREKIERGREKKKRGRERRRLRQQRSASGATNFFHFESGNILPPCPVNNDESDHEGDENDKSDKESEGDENGKSDKESEGDEE
ncbi:hypothetical protein H5410_005035 [Solanum commersonii]|uniref:Uncharacterized protein n=1 Tax=Solanum commersonii TaxID=4109 RepID=A0A9J6A5K0_SOLCO|nr:hypothetical protein H5410_005035 [Solanum commersonii]